MYTARERNGARICPPFTRNCSRRPRQPHGTRPRRRRTPRCSCRLHCSDKYTKASRSSHRRHRLSQHHRRPRSHSHLCRSRPLHRSLSLGSGGRSSMQRSSSSSRSPARAHTAPDTTAGLASAAANCCYCCGCTRAVWTRTGVGHNLWILMDGWIIDKQKNNFRLQPLSHIFISVSSKCTARPSPQSPLKHPCCPGSHDVAGWYFRVLSQLACRSFPCPC